MCYSSLIVDYLRVLCYFDDWIHWRMWLYYLYSCTGVHYVRCTVSDRYSIPPVRVTSHCHHSYVHTLWMLPHCWQKFAVSPARQLGPNSWRCLRSIHQWPVSLSGQDVDFGDPWLFCTQLCLQAIIISVKATDTCIDRQLAPVRFVLPPPSSRSAHGSRLRIDQLVAFNPANAYTRWVQCSTRSSLKLNIPFPGL